MPYRSYSCRGGRVDPGIRRKRACGGSFVGGHLDDRIARCRCCCMVDHRGGDLAESVDRRVVVIFWEWSRCGWW
jgi:hypothetical protein